MATGPTAPNITAVPLQLSAEQLEKYRQLAAEGVLLPSDTGVPFVPYGDGWAVPVMVGYSGRFGEVAFDLVIEYDVPEARMRCASASFEGNGPGRYVDNDVLKRFPLATAVAEALLWVAREVDEAGKVTGDPLSARAASIDEARDVYAQVQTEHRRRSPGRRLQVDSRDELLAEIAHIYLNALSSGKPTKAVFDHYGGLYNRRYVGRLVQQAREQGFLEPAPGRGRAGIQRKEKHDG